MDKTQINIKLEKKYLNLLDAFKKRMGVSRTVAIKLLIYATKKEKEVKIG